MVLYNLIDCFKFMLLKGYLRGIYMTNQEIVEQMKKQDETISKRREELAKLMANNPVEEMIKMNKRFNEELKSKNCKILNYKDCKVSLKDNRGEEDGEK